MNWRRLAGRVVLVCVLVGTAISSLPAQEAKWKELNQQLEALLKERKYREAEQVAREALRVAEETFGAEHLNVAESLVELGSLLDETGRPAEGEPLLRRALKIREAALGPDDPKVGSVLNELGLACVDLDKLSEAEEFYRRAQAIAEKSFGRDDPRIATTLGNLGNLYARQERLSESEAAFQRALSITEKAYGAESREVAPRLIDMARAHYQQFRLDEAAKLLERALAIREKVYGPEHPAVAGVVNNLAIIYDNQARFREAEQLYRRALAIWEKTYGPEHPYVRAAVTNVAQVLSDRGEFAEAETYYKRSLAITEKALGPEHSEVANDLQNLAVLYAQQGRYDETEPLLRRALAIYEKVFGPDHPSVAGTLNALGNLSRIQKKYEQAEALLNRSVAIEEAAYGPDSPKLGSNVYNLGVVYSEEKKYAEAEANYQRALRLWEKGYGAEHPEVAFPLDSLANLYSQQSKYEAAEPLYQRALSLREKALGPEHRHTSRVLLDFAGSYYAQGKREQAGELFERALKGYRAQLEYHFTYMSEKDRLTFLETLEGLFPVYYSFCFTNREAEPALVGKMYDVALWQKGFVAQSIAAVRSQIAASGDAEGLAAMERLMAKKTQLAKLLQSTPEEPASWRKQVEQLEKEANELEREVVKRSAGLAEEKRLARVSWREVQKALKPGEAAVEFLRFRYHDGKDWTGKSYYVGLVVTPETTEGPRLVVLGEADKLEGEGLAEYRELVSAGGAARAGAADRVREALWAPLETALGGARQVYLSPDGVLNLVAWNALPAKGRGRLLEVYDLRLVTSTKDLLREGRAGATSAVLVGHPQFALEENKQRQAVSALEKPEEKTMVAYLVRGSRSRDQRGQMLAPLPGTKAELDTVQGLLEKRGWQVERLSEAAAVEEAVKRVRAPRLLHLATHGFFLADLEAAAGERSGETASEQEDPMLRSGLFLAGAERALGGEATPADLDDGILTAYEASGLNLQGTELVVLSACDTGLGEVKNGEGVFGLRRALQVAGAEAVLMSLWEVPDRETQELMELFYQRWLGGRSKAEALRWAQQQMRKRVAKRYGDDRPYYWGAFVLVGR